MSTGSLIKCIDIGQKKASGAPNFSAELSLSPPWCLGRSVEKRNESQTPLHSWAIPLYTKMEFIQEFSYSLALWKVANKGLLMVRQIHIYTF